MRGQNFYVEVALGCSSSPCKESKSESIDQAPVMERTFIYPPEAVLVPMMHRAFSRFSSKRYLLPSLINSVCRVYHSFSTMVYGYLVFSSSDHKFSQKVKNNYFALCNNSYQSALYISFFSF